MSHEIPHEFLRKQEWGDPVQSQVSVCFTGEITLPLSGFAQLDAQGPPPLGLGKETKIGREQTKEGGKRDGKHSLL